MIFSIVLLDRLKNAIVLEYSHKYRLHELHPEPHLIDKFVSKIFSIKALKYISTKMKSTTKQFNNDQSNRRNRLDEARELLAHIILAHVPVSFDSIE